MADGRRQTADGRRQTAEVRAAARRPGEPIARPSAHVIERGVHCRRMGAAIALLTVVLGCLQGAGGQAVPIATPHGLASEVYDQPNAGAGDPRWCSDLAAVPEATGWAPADARESRQKSETGQADQTGETPESTAISALPRQIAGDFAHLPSWQTLRTATIGAGVTLVGHAADGDANRHLARGGMLHDSFVPGRVIGPGVVQVALAVATYAIGRAAESNRATVVGAHMLRADALTAAMTYPLKWAVDRKRPDGGDYSFPSSHASFTFATATVLARDLGWRVGVPAYMFATYVAASRLHENRHYLSDVLAGATIGIIAGRTATRHRPSRYAVIPTAFPGGLGIQVSISSAGRGSRIPLP